MNTKKISRFMRNEQNNLGQGLSSHMGEKTQDWDYQDKGEDWDYQG